MEYRLHLIIQEAKKFMVHGKRATLLPEDVEYAMEALNVEVGDDAWLKTTSSCWARQQRYRTVLPE